MTLAADTLDAVYRTEATYNTALGLNRAEWGADLDGAFLVITDHNGERTVVTGKMKDILREVTKRKINERALAYIRYHALLMKGKTPGEAWATIQQFGNGHRAYTDDEVKDILGLTLASEAPPPAEEDWRPE